MGIPSYFSHIIKNHNIIIQKQKLNKQIDNLYIDSNSIIYDVIHNENIKNMTNEDIYKDICIKLVYYINEINPNKYVYISFDGIAPVAKLAQQRTRRIKNTILNKITNTINNKETKWDSTQITPGTSFMKSLNTYIKNYFNHFKHNAKIILSLTDDKGEGEHKLFHFIRNNEHHKNENTVIYGLDADLIMLSLLHLKFCNNIFLYRETPEFIKQIDTSLDASKLYLISINHLSKRITIDMNNGNDNYNEDILITDYVFLCFLLGNDFIPHNPGLNIRTNGIDIILDIYRQYFSSDKSIIVDNKINWKNFKKFLTYIAHEETNYFIHEYEMRNKFEKRRIPNETKEDKIYKLNILPSIHRETEHYINPTKSMWEHRYYNTLFDIEYEETRINQICINYIEAIEWTWKYYSNKCFDWRWKYNYDYAPLFKDVVKYIPYYTHDFINTENENAISDLTQLVYVLPEESHYLIPSKIKNIIDIKYKHWFDKSTINFKWHYCKYLWEAHLTLPHIDIETIENKLIF